MFKFQLKTHLEFGEGKSRQLAEFIAQRGFKKIALIVDHGVVGNTIVQQSLESLASTDLDHQLFINDRAEPDYDYLDSFKEPFLNVGFDCLVGIGGGSTLDVTKGIAVLITNEGKAIDYRGFPKLKNKPVPVIAIPTTAGTGSEVTFNAVFTDSHEKRKLGINSEDNYPVLAIIDPLMTVECPKSVTVSSGCDALVHTLESFVHKDHTLVSRMFAKQAFRLIYNNLTKVLDDPENITIRSHLALGAYLAAIALMNAGSGPAGAFSYPFGVHYKVPHGYAGAAFLPAITKLNIEKGYQDYAELYDLMEGSNRALPSDEKNKLFAKAISDLMEKLDVGAVLQTYALKPKDIEFLIGQYDALKTGIDQNPVAITKSDVEQMMHSLFSKRGEYAGV